MYLEIFLADFAFFGEFRGISWKNLNFTGPRPRKISEALLSTCSFSLLNHSWFNNRFSWFKWLHIALPNQQFNCAGNMPTQTAVITLIFCYFVCALILVTFWDSMHTLYYVVYVHVLVCLCLIRSISIQGIYSCII